MRKMKKVMGVLLSLLMLMQFVVVPASAAQKLSTPSGFAVVNEWGDMILDFSDSTPAQYVDHYLVYFYAIGGGVVYDPGYRGMYDYSDLYIEDLYQDFEDIKDEFERDGMNTANLKLAMRAQAISNDPNACADSDMSIYFGIDGKSLDSEITYLAGGVVSDTVTWKLTKDYELIVSGTGDADISWLWQHPEAGMAEKVIFEDGITSCEYGIGQFFKVREVYIHDADFDIEWNDLGIYQNAVVYLPANSPYFQRKLDESMQYADVYEPHYAKITDAGENFRYLVNEEYVDAAKIISDLGILPYIYVKRNDNVTKSELAVAMARLQVRGLFMDENSYYSDLESGSYECGAANEYIDVLLPESDSVYGKDVEITYQNILDLVSAEFPNGPAVSIAGKSASSKVTQQELAYLLNQLLTPDYLMYGTEGELYVFRGSISDVYCDPECSYQYYGTLNGTLQGTFTSVGAEIIEDYDALIMDYDGVGLTEDDDITLYIVYNEVRTGVLSTYDIDRDNTKYSASFTINNGAEETSNRFVTLQLAAEGYTKYKIEGGNYMPLSANASYTLSSTHGEQSISITFANADESKKKTVTQSIKLNNLRTVTYLVDGQVWRTEQVGCGLPIPELTVVPEKAGLVFDSWLNMPTVMPDNNISVTAKFTDIPPVGQGTCGTSANWVLYQDGTLNITGTGAMATDGYPEYMFEPYRDQIKKVTIAGGITEIGDSMLYELFEMEEVSIPSTVTKIGEGFVKGSKVSKVTIPANVQTVNMQMSFVKCEQLSEIVVLGKDTNLDFSAANTIVSGVTIYGFTNSSADVYATYNGCNFVAMDPDFRINDGATETDNATVTLTFNDYAKEYTQFNINGGRWMNMADTASYTVDSADGEKTITVVFKKGNEEFEKTHTIVYNNKHKVIYMVNGTEFTSVEFGCGAPVTGINNVPQVSGYTFLGWDALPEVMPDNDVICNAVLAEAPTANELQGVLTEEEVSDGYTASAQIAVTTASSDMQTAIDAKAEYTPALILDITLEKVKDGEQPQAITETDSLVMFTVDIPAEVQGNFSYIVLREHNGAVDALTETPNENGEYVKFVGGKLEIYANRFSTYTLLAKEIVRTGGLGTAGISGCTVRFETNGAGSISSQSLTRGSKATEPEAPAKKGYIFDGWYKDKELTEKFSFATAINKTITLYAKWIEAPKAEILLTIGEKTAIVNGETITNDVAPVIVNDRTMLPIRFIAEALGATVGWDKATKTATVELGEISIAIVIGEEFATVNGKVVELDSPSFIEDSRTFLPIRFVTENLGAKVEWNAGDKTVTITK